MGQIEASRTLLSGFTPRKGLETLVKKLFRPRSAEEDSRIKRAEELRVYAKSIAEYLPAGELWLRSTLSNAKDFPVRNFAQIFSEEDKLALVSDKKVVEALGGLQKTLPQRGRVNPRLQFRENPEDFISTTVWCLTDSLEVLRIPR